MKECITVLNNYLVEEIANRDLVGLMIRKTDNVQNKVVSISFQRRDQLKPDVVWDGHSKVFQSNDRFGQIDRLAVHLDHVRMSAGKGREKMKRRSLDLLSATKRSIVVVKAALLCLAHVLIIAMARVNDDPKYKSYKNGSGLKERVEEFLMASGADLSNGGCLEELQNLQEYVSDYKIVVSWFVPR